MTIRGRMFEWYMIIYTVYMYVCLCVYVCMCVYECVCVHPCVCVHACLYCIMRTLFMKCEGT